jgi:pyruvate dehydrogenase (quinone)
VIDLETTLLQQFLNIAQRKRIAKIPPDCTKYEAGFGLAPFEDRGSGYHLAILSHHQLTTLNVATHPSQPEQMPRVLEIAMQTALSRRGVAVISLPGDIALRDTVEDKPRMRFAESKTKVCPSDEEINILANLLNQSKRITILGGAGCAGAHAELIELAGKLQAPIVHAMRGKEFIEYDNPFDVGMTGLLGFFSGYNAMMNCDVLLMIGTDFPYQQFFPKNATVVQIDIRGEQLGRRTKLDYGFVGDTKTTLSALIPKLRQNDFEGHLTASRENYRNARKGLNDLADKSRKGPIHPQYVTRVLDQLAAEDAVVHVRCGHADDLGGASSDDERQATDHWLVQSRLDGQRVAAGDWCTGESSRTPGDRNVRGDVLQTRPMKHANRISAYF